MTADDRLLSGASSESSLHPNKSSGDIGELKPCPFCGKLPRTVDAEPIGGAAMIWCASDDCMGPSTTAGNMRDATVQWNTRTPDSESAAEIERLRREVEELREWKSSVLAKCKTCDRWDALHWGGDKEGWGFVHYFIGYLNTRALSAESALAAAWEEAAKKSADDLVNICEAAQRLAHRTGNTFVLDRQRVAAMIVGNARASAIRAAGAEKKAESGHPPSTTEPD